ncbi:MAG TPA: aconitase X catalytic domain-containing protein [Methanoregulaceae archaeon]|nr:aconitase X catalytic domain-containing protein [Methanoregulaceae archaeon]
MELDREDELVLSGEFGDTARMMMEMLVALGKVFGAERMVPIRSAQVSGASYKTIGKYGLEWLNTLKARVAVPTVLNPVGMDRERWREMGISPGFAKKQAEVINAYDRLGVRLECTCTPYYNSITQFGDHIAWSESSAVAYANSVIGARTNREGGPGALAAAVIGKTPFYGLHIIGNRKPGLVFTVDGDAGQDTAWYGALGYLAGKEAGNRIPYFRGIRPGRDQMKALGAAMAASGAVALFHIEGITPDARVFSYDTEHLETIHIGQEAIRSVFSDIPVDAVAIGCPHCSQDELSTAARLLRGKKVKIPVLIFTSGTVKTASKGDVETIERSGARVFTDTCMVVSPCMDNFRAIMVNSGKAFAYVPNMCGALARIGTIRECIDIATA